MYMAFSSMSWQRPGRATRRMSPSAFSQRQETGLLIAMNHSLIAMVRTRCNVISNLLLFFGLKLSRRSCLMMGTIWHVFSSCLLSNVKATESCWSNSVSPFSSSCAIFLCWTSHLEWSGRGGHFLCLHWCFLPMSFCIGRIKKYKKKALASPWD